MENDNFITWPGGECPVPFDVVVTVKLASGNTVTRRADTFTWQHYRSEPANQGNIVEYKVVG